MEGAILRPSMKTVWFAYVLAGAAFLAGEWTVFHFGASGPAWLYAIPLVVFLPPLKMHWGRSLITLRLQNDHLTLETGFLSRTRRTVDMAKIQDVTVSQTLTQRILGTGDLMLESAGESGRMSIRNLNRPRTIADAIINSSKQGRTFF
jgi:uncharacterized membrane protein YdbT with pleckstrin-like domain